MFTRGYRPNQVSPFGVIFETAGGTNPYFVTGLLQNVQSVFGGLEITPQGVVQLKTQLPKAW